MIYLLFSILSSSLIYVVFKLLGKFKVITLYAIIVNYLTACLCGYVQHAQHVNWAKIPARPWFWGAISLGFLFITVFNLMAITTQKNGLSVVSVASKMSVALSIAFVVFYYKEPLHLLKITGILTALVAVYLVSVKTRKGIQVKKNVLLFPVLVFLGSGIIESLIKYTEQAHVAPSEVALFSSTVFGVALSIGIIVGIIQFIRKKRKFTYREILGGVALGLPNYFSIYFFIQALRSPLLESSTVFIINNVAIVLLSTFLGIFFFREKLLRKNWIGIVLAIISIILVAFSTTY